MKIPPNSSERTTGLGFVNLLNDPLLVKKSPIKKLYRRRSFLDIASAKRGRGRPRKVPTIDVSIASTKDTELSPKMRDYQFLAKKKGAR